MRKPISVLVYPIRRSAGDWEFMLMRRIANPDLGLDGFWQGVTGALEKGEDLIAAARRELVEETSFIPSSIEKTGFSYSFPKDDKWKTMYPKEVNEITEHVLIAFIEGSTAPTLSHEHDAFEWCNLDQALGKLKYPGNIEGLRRCDILLESRLNSKG